MSIFTKFIDRFQGKTIFISGMNNRSKPKNISIEQNEICTAILDCNATHIARGNVLHIIEKDGRIAEIKRSSEYTRLFQTPNHMMSKKDFIYAIAWQLQVLNTAFAWIKWDKGMHPIEVWPLVYLNFELREKKAGGYAVQFTDSDGVQQIVDAEDLIILRRKFDATGFSAKGNNEISNALDMTLSLDDALRQATQISNKINGIMKQKKAMLSSTGNTQVQDDASERIKYAAKNGGILSLDAMEEYTPLNPTTWAATAAQSKQIFDRIYTFWRTPEEVVNNKAPEQTMQNYYDSIVEPVWEIMGEAFSKALFTRRELGCGNKMVITSGAATGASWQTKLNIVNNTKELGLLTTNEYRELLGYAPVEDGDKRMISLNYINSKDQSKYQTGKEGEKNGE